MAETKFLDSAGLTHLLEKTNAKFSEIKDVHSIKLINQSVTGLFEQEIDLLK